MELNLRKLSVDISFEQLLVRIEGSLSYPFVETEERGGLDIEVHLMRHQFSSVHKHRQVADAEHARVIRVVP